MVCLHFSNFFVIFFKEVDADSEAFTICNFFLYMRSLFWHSFTTYQPDPTGKIISLLELFLCSGDQWRMKRRFWTRSSLELSAPWRNKFVPFLFWHILDHHYVHLMFLFEVDGRKLWSILFFMFITKRLGFNFM